MTTPMGFCANSGDERTVRAKGLAEAESQKAKAEALAAFEGVAQRAVRVNVD